MKKSEIILGEMIPDTRFKALCFLPKYRIRCLCICGKIGDLYIFSLSGSRMTKSCGCLRRERGKLLNKISVRVRREKKRRRYIDIDIPDYIHLAQSLPWRYKDDKEDKNSKSTKEN